MCSIQGCTPTGKLFNLAEPARRLAEIKDVDVDGSFEQRRPSEVTACRDERIGDDVILPARDRGVRLTPASYTAAPVFHRAPWPNACAAGKMF